MNGKLFPALFNSKLKLDFGNANAFASFLAVLVPVFVQVNVLENGASFGDNGYPGATTFAKLIPPCDIDASAFEPSDWDELTVVTFCYRSFLLKHAFDFIHDDDGRLFHLTLKLHRKMRFTSRIFQLVYILRVDRDVFSLFVPDRVFDVQLEWEGQREFDFGDVFERRFDVQDEEDHGFMRGFL